MIAIQDMSSLFNHLSERYQQLSELSGRMKPGYLEGIFRHVPARDIPKHGTKAYRALALLSDGLPHDVWELWLWLASPAGPRSAIQALTNERKGGGYLWLIENINDSGPAVYQLAALHLEGTPEADARARLLARKRWLERSENLADSEARRRPEIKEKKARFLSDHPEFRFGPSGPLSEV